MTTEVDVTVILCTYNRAMWLRDVLDCLLKLRTDGAFTYEIVVVDNASTDDTPQIVADVIREAPLPMRYLRESHPGPSAARNRGIAAARGTWLAFIDDDELADPNWLFELLRMAEHKRVRVVGGAVRLVLSEATSSVVPPALESILVPGGHRESACHFTPRYALNSGNQLLARSVFDEIGVYAESWTEGGEDTELFTRIQAAGIEAWYTPTAVVRHLVPSYRLTPGYLQWLSLRQGWTRARQDLERHGWLRAGTLAALRAAHAGCLLIPWAAAKALRRPDRALRRRCQLWRTQGYLRGVLRGIAPVWFPQHQFLSRLDFRSERQQFV